MAIGMDSKRKSETMDYPQSYLDAQIQTTSEDFPIELLWHTNADVIAGRVEKPTGFLDPFGDPDGWVKYREAHDMKPKHWKSNIELNYPWLDPKKEWKAMKAFRSERDDIERMARCGCKQCKTNPLTGKVEVIYVFMCRNPKCPNCGPYMIEKRADDLKKLAFKKNSKVIEVSEEEAAKMARKLKKELGAYRSYPGKDGKVTFVITPEDEQEIPEGFEDLTFKKCDEIAKDSIMAKGKRSSIVGPKQTEEQEENKEEEEPEEEPNTEQPVEILARKMEIGFNEIVKNERDLQELVEAEVHIEESPKTEYKLQYAIYLMEQTTKKICEERGLSFNYVYTNKEKVLLSRVNWSWVKEKQKRLILA